MAEKIVRLVAQVDVRQFKLDPMDGFVLTRIDGRLGKKELARETGLPEFQIERTLEKLEKLGVVESFDPNAKVEPPPKSEPEPRRANLPEFTSLLEAKYDPAELDEDVDLSAEQKKRVLDLFYRLDDLDHYTLLGVGKDADKKSIKRAYFELASVLHPDRYFKKRLGSFKAKMEQLFGRVTEAHDTLVDATKRLDYNAYLEDVATTRGMEAMFERALEESRRAAATPLEPPTAREPSVPPPRASSIPPSGPNLAPAELKKRREALAKRLLGRHQTGRPPAPPAASAAETSPYRYTNSADAVDALKRRYEERVESATAGQARKYIKAAEDAQLRNDVVAAASSFHMATKFAPDDTALAMRYQEAKNQADRQLCEGYVKQAQYEEKNQHWPEAARSWQKVAKIRGSDARAHERAAFCLLRTDAPDDLQQAAAHAKQAVMTEPKHVEHHAILAEIYLKAGLNATAKRAAEAGLAIDPKHAALAAIMKKVSGKS